MLFSGCGMSKHNDRFALIRDSNYFLTETIRRLDRLAELDDLPVWHQSRVVSRRVRDAVRFEAGRELERMRANG